MGLKLRYSLFYNVDPADVYDAYTRFWAAMGHPARPVPPSDRDPFNTLTLHEPNNGWTILEWDAGWEYSIRRQAQMLASLVLECAGLFVFVRDGDYWGYELFRAGSGLDHFVQDPDEAYSWFLSGDSYRGQPEAVAAAFPWVSARDVAAYLVQHPQVEGAETEAALRKAREEYDRLNVRARLGDQYTRFEDCAVLDFLRLLGVDVAVRDSYVTLATPIWRSFELTGWSTLAEHRHPVKPSWR